MARQEPVLVWESPVLELQMVTPTTVLKPTSLTLFFCRNQQSQLKKNLAAQHHRSYVEFFLQG